MFLVFSLILAAIVADVAVESALGDGTSFVVAGQDLASGIDPAVVTLSIAAAAAVVAILLTRAIGGTRGQRRGADLRIRRDEIAHAEASLEARRRMVEGRLRELQLNHDELLAKRDALLAEVDRLRARDEELEERVAKRHREVAAARRELADMTVARATAGATAGAASAEPQQQREPMEQTKKDLTVVPDVAERTAEPPRH